MFLLDTDHLSFLQRMQSSEHSAIVGRMRSYSLDSFFVSIVSFHEQVNGWNAYIRRARSIEKVVRGYGMLNALLLDFARMNIAPFDLRSAGIFADLRSKGVRVATMDLRIGSIALSRDMTLLTRNSVDFARIPNLRCEDWTT